MSPPAYRPTSYNLGVNFVFLVELLAVRCFIGALEWNSVSAIKSIFINFENDC